MSNKFIPMDEMFPSSGKAGASPSANQGKFIPMEQMFPSAQTAQKKEPSFLDTAVQAGKDAFGGIESVGRLAWNVPVGFTSMGLGAAYGTAKGLRKGLPLDEAVTSGMHTGEAAQEAVTIPALTKSGAVADEMLGEGYDYVKRDVFAEALMTLAREEWKHLKDLTPEAKNRLEAARRSLYEGTFDAIMFNGLIKKGLSIPKAIEASKKKKADAKAAEADYLRRSVNPDPRPSKAEPVSVPTFEEWRAKKIAEGWDERPQTKGGDGPLPRAGYENELRAQEQQFAHDQGIFPTREGTPEGYRPTEQQRAVTPTDIQDASGLEPSSGRQGGPEIPGKEFRKFAREFRQSTGDLFDVTKNKQLLQDAPEVPHGLDYWGSRLADEQLFFDKASRNAIAAGLDQSIQAQTTIVRRISENLSKAKQDAVQKYGDNLRTVQTKVPEIDRLQRKLDKAVAKKQGLEDNLRQKMADIYVKTRSDKGTQRLVYPDRAFTGERAGRMAEWERKMSKDYDKIGNRWQRKSGGISGPKNQRGSLFIGEIYEGIKVIKERAKKFFENERANQYWEKLTPTQRNFISTQNRLKTEQKIEKFKRDAEQLEKDMPKIKARIEETYQEALQKMDQMLKDIDQKVEADWNSRLIAAVESGKSVFKGEKKTTPYELTEYYKIKPLKDISDVDAHWSTARNNQGEMYPRATRPVYPKSDIRGPLGKQRGAIGDLENLPKKNVVDFAPYKEQADGMRAQAEQAAFHDQLREKVAERAATKERLLQHWMDKHPPEYQIGERIRSSKTNKVYEITGYEWSDAKDTTRTGHKGFQYTYKTADGESGRFTGALIKPDDFIKLTGPRPLNPIAQWVPKNQRGMLNLFGKDAPPKTPEERMVDLAKGKSLSRFTEDLVSEFGSELKPYAEALYQNAKSQEAREQKAQAGTQTTPKSKDVSPKTTKADKLHAKRVAAGISDLANARDLRPGAEVAADLKQNPIPDAPSSVGARIRRAWAQGQTYARKHPIINWVYDRADTTERSINRESNRLLYGENLVARSFDPLKRQFKFTANRLAIREADQGSMIHEYNTLKKSSRLKIAETANKYNGVKEPTEGELRADGLSTQEIKAYRNLRNGFERFWDEYLVPTATKIGIALPEKIPGYFPAQWFGDYRVWGIDKVVGSPTYGQRVWVTGVSTMGEAKRTIKVLQERFPELSFTREDVSTVRHDYTSTSDAFVDAIKLFGRNSEIGQALTKAQHELLPRKGWRKSLTRRKGIEGAAGTWEGGDAQLGNFEKGIQSYIHAGMKYVKNKELMLELDKVLKDNELRERYPEAISMADNMIGSYLGADKFTDAWWRHFMLQLGTDTRLPEKALRHVASMVMYTKVMMWKAPFYLAQGLQDGFVIPKLKQFKDLGINGDVSAAAAKGFADWIDGRGREAIIREWVADGIIEPKFAEQVLFSKTLKGRMEWQDGLNALTGNQLSAMLDSSTRLRAALTMLNFFESAGMDTKTAAAHAAKHSLDIMVEYERWKRAPIFREIGVTGNAFSPLTTFMNNMINHLGEYIKFAGKGAAQPIAYLAGIYVLLSGLYGFPFRQDLDDMIDTINHLVGINIPTVSDFMSAHSGEIGDALLFGAPSYLFGANSGPANFINDTAEFGVPSAITGYNFAASLGAPNISESVIPGLGDPAPQFVYQNIKNSGKLAINATLGKESTIAEKLAAVKSAAPTAPGAGMVESYFSPSNKDRGGDALDVMGSMWPRDRDIKTPNPQGEGNYVRDPEAQWARLLGLKSLGETRFDMASRRFLKIDKERADRRNRGVTLAVDAISGGEPAPQEALNLYFHNGGEVEAFIDSVLSKLESRQKDFVTRQRDKDLGTITALQRAKLLSDLRVRARKQTND